MRKIVAAVATSLDGFIARRDGAFDWLPNRDQEQDFGMRSFLQSIDTVIWGRKTYDQALALGRGLFPKMRNLVFTHRPPEPKRGVEFVDQPVADYARKLRVAEGKDVWLMGGGNMIASFLDAGGLDEFHLAIAPVLIGEGIPLLSPRHRLIRLELLETKPFPHGVVSLKYRVLR